MGCDRVGVYHAGFMVWDHCVQFTPTCESGKSPLQSAPPHHPPPLLPRNPPPLLPHHPPPLLDPHSTAPPLLPPNPNPPSHLPPHPPPTLLHPKSAPPPLLPPLRCLPADLAGGVGGEDDAWWGGEARVLFRFEAVFWDVVSITGMRFEGSGLR